MARRYSSAQFDIDFDQRPSLDEQACEIKRHTAPKSGHWDGHCLSEEPLYFRAHFVAGKTTPHLRDKCPGCIAGNLGEVRVYIFYHITHNSTVVALDLPTGCISTLQAATKRHGKIKGLPIRISRRGKGERGPVDIQVGLFIDIGWGGIQTPSLSEWCANLWGEALEKLIFAMDNVDPIASQRDQVKIHGTTPGGSAKKEQTRRSPRGCLEASMRNQEDSDVIAARAELLAALTSVSKVNGHSADAS